MTLPSRRVRVVIFVVLANVLLLAAVEAVSALVVRLLGFTTPPAVFQVDNPDLKEIRSAPTILSARLIRAPASIM